MIRTIVARALSFVCVWTLSHAGDAHSQWVQTAGQGRYYVSRLFSNEGVLFAGTRTGLFRSFSHGATWTKVTTGPPDSDSYDFCFAVCNGKLYAGTLGGLFVTTNNGDDWSRISNGVSDFVMSLSAYDHHLYVGTDSGLFHTSDEGASWTRFARGDYVERVVANKACILVGTDGSFISSTDQGKNWKTVVSDGITMLSSCGSIIWADAENAYLYRSNDSGITWRSVARPTIYSLDLSEIVMRGDTVFCATSGNGLYRSVVGASGWTRIGAGLADPSFTSLLIDDSTIFAGSFTHGVFATHDNGDTWDETNQGMPFLYDYSHAVTWFNDTLFIGTDIGMFLSGDGGHAWTELRWRLGFTWSVFGFQSVGDTLFAVAEFGIVSSTDGGQHWRRTQIESVTRAFAELGGTLFAAGVYGVIHTSNAGGTWVADSGLPQYLNVNCFLQRGPALYAGAAYGVYVTRDTGRYWSLEDSGMAEQSVVRCLVVHHGKVFAGTTSGVYVSEADGAPWRSIAAGLPDPTHVAAFLSYGDLLFAGDLGAVWVSSDDGKTWGNVAAGLPSDVQVLALTTAPVNLFDPTGTLFAATSQGVWRTPLNDLFTAVRGTTNSPFTVNEINLLAHPNPCDAATEIGFALDNASRPTVEIFTVLGQRVATLECADIKSGPHTQRIATNGLRPGTYCCRLNTGNSIRSTRIVVIH